VVYPLPGLLLPERPAGRWVQAPRLTFELVEEMDEGQSDQALQLVALLRLVEVAPDVGHAAHLHDPSTIGRGIDPEEGVEAGKGIRLQVALELAQESLRPAAAAVGAVLKDDVGMLLVTDVGPEPAQPGVIPAAIQDRDRRVVGSQDGRAEDDLLEPANERLQQDGSLLRPVAQSRGAQTNAVALQDLRLTVQGTVIRKLRHQDLGEQPRAGQTLLDRLRRYGCDGHVGLAAPAGVLEADVLADDERSGHVVKLLGDLLAHLLPLRAALRTGELGLLERMLDALAHQVFGQAAPTVRPSLVPELLGRGLFSEERLAYGALCRFLLGRPRLLDQLGEGETELAGIDLLGAPAEDVVQEQVQAL